MGVTLSIILCNFNDAVLLPGAVDALIKQSVAPCEIILVDDGSSDNSVEIIRTLAARHPLIRPVFLPENKGVVAAGNAGLAMARGSHVGWFAADDRILPGHFERVAQALETGGDAAVVTSPVVLAAPDGAERIYDFDLDGSVPHRFTPEQLVGVLRRRYLWLPSQAAVLRRVDLLALGGWNLDMDWLSDWFAIYALALRGGAVCLTQPGARVLERPESYGRRRAASGWERAWSTLFATLADPANRDLWIRFAGSPYLLTGPFGMRIAGEALRHSGGRLLGLRLLVWRLLASRKIGLGHIPGLAELALPAMPASEFKRAG